MIITDLARRGESELYKVYVDDEFVCLMQAETIVKNKLKKGQEIDKQTFDNVFNQSQILTCKNQAINYVAKCLKTQKQVEIYLKQKGYTDVAIKNAVTLLLDYGYLNDKYYAECFVKSKQNTKGINYIKNALKQKGINANIIDDVTKDYKANEEELLKIAEKYLKNKKMDQNIKQKLFRHLIGKGFNFDEINKTINKVLKGVYNDWD